ncbi:MAG: hypothetical protein HC904_11420 [Blastochloris sp.]|nr:hypothetical protein [Blastochloris sp.]
MIFAWMSLTTLYSLHDNYSNYTLQNTFETITTALSALESQEIEPELPKTMPKIIWIGFIAYALLFAGCSVCLWRFAIPLGRQFLKGTEES